MHPQQQTSIPPLPPKRKRRGRTVLITLGVIIGLIVLANAFGGGKQDKSGTGATVAAAPAAAAPGGGAQPAKTGVEVRDGKFAFTVTKVETGLSTIGSGYTKSTAQGSYVLVHLTVHNIGTAPQMFSDSSQKLIDAGGRQFGSDSAAAVISLSQEKALLTTINPGNSVTGTLVFDVPTDVKLAAIELHDSPFSGGVKVTVAG